METLFRYVAPPSACGYLPGQQWSLEYELVADLSREEYQERLLRGWRRFGAMLFRPRCPACRACQSLRVDVARFRPNRSQRRAWRDNAGDVEVRAGRPAVTPAKLRLYDLFHRHQAEHKGWPLHPAKDAAGYRQSFVDNPFPTQEWCYYLGGRLIAVGYVDDLPRGLSAIYFYYDPQHRRRSLGTFNVLLLLEESRRRGLPYLYLGYHVAGSASLAYKANFAPNQVLGPDGEWHDYRQ